ncbi:MAG: serine/threonine protein kinase [Alphaproteobacteria bacterium]|nr:serine/threonine protein kinase [Alphaproteobacteria bacterium]
MTQIFSPSQMIGDRYQIHSFVNEGGMQQVYKTLDTRLDRVVALKTPLNESAEKRFTASACLSAKVNHPHVAKTLDLFSYGDRQILIEEFVPGLNLKELYDRDFIYMDPYLVGYLFHRLAKGLAASHHVGVFHRDLKPSNIIVSDEPLPQVLKITDFGIAKMAEEKFEIIPTAIREEKTVTLEASKTIKGAFPYMAPELLQNQNPGLAADVWSVGAIAYELLCGKKPFGEGTSGLVKVVTGQKPEVPPLEKINAQFQGLHDELWRLILRCFEFEPSDRITADELVGACGELCYSCAPRKKGTVAKLRINNWKIGILEGDDDETTFFHYDSFYGQPSIGTRVLYAEFTGVPHNRAHPILAIKEESDKELIPF